MRSTKTTRLALASCAFAFVGLTASASLAQEHEPAVEHAPMTGHAAPAVGHGGAASPAAHGEPSGEPHAEGAQHGHEAGGEHAGGHHGPEAINWTDIWDKRRPAIVALVLNFGILLSLYYMLGRKPVAAGLTQRRVTIGKEIEEAQKLLDEAEERAEKYQGNLKNVDADADAAKAALISSGKGEASHLVTEAEERAQRMKRDAERLVQQERKQLQQELLVETVEMSVVEAAQVLAKSVTADDHARLAHDLLAELSRRPSARASGSVPSGGAS